MKTKSLPVSMPAPTRAFLLAITFLLHAGIVCPVVRGAVAGEVDLTFDAGSGVNGHVDTALAQPDGKVLIAGSFTTVDGFTRPGLARLHADGSGDAGFTPAPGFASIAIVDIFLQADGRMLVCGQYKGYAANAYAARLNSDGSLDESFTAVTGTYPRYPYGEGIGYTSVVAQPDGKVLLCGFFTDYFVDSAGGDKYPPRSFIVRLDSTGALDTSFAAGRGEYYTRIETAILQPDGKVLIGGAIQSGAGIARLHPDGSRDSTFNPDAGAGQSVLSIALQTDGKVLIGGSFSGREGTSGNGIGRLNPDGSSDGSFYAGTGKDRTVYSVAVQADGRVLAGGRFTSVNGTSRNGIVRLNANGSVDSSFDPGSGVDSYAAVHSAFLQTDGRVLISGSFHSINGTNCERVARLNPNGSLDTGFNPGSGLDGAVNALAPQPDGKVLIAGRFNTVGGGNRSGIARVHANGSLDTGFNPGTGAGFDPIYIGGDVFAVIGLTGGKVFIGGTFDTIDGIARSGVARLNADGSLDSSFSPDTEANNTAFACALQPDGKLLIGGHFTTSSGAFYKNIIRLNSDGSRDTGFNADPQVAYLFRVNTLVLQSDAMLLVGGAATTLVSDPENGDYWATGYLLMRLRPDGSRDATFEPATGEAGPVRTSITTVALQSDGKVLVGGEFVTFKGANRNRIARLNPNGTLDAGFDPATAIAGSLDVNKPALESIAVQPGGKVIVAGAFAAVNGANGNNLIRLHANGSLDSSFHPGTGPDARVRSIALLPDGNLLIGGDFTTVNGAVRPKMARIYGNSPPPDSYATWVAGYGLTEAGAAASADPDKDGLPNGVEYVLGGNPNVPETSGGLTPAIAGDNMFVTFLRDDWSETSDAVVTVETGADLDTWPAVFVIGPNSAASSPGVTIIENGTAPDSITVSIPQGTAERLFARLKVTIAP